MKTPEIPPQQIPGQHIDPLKNQAEVSPNNQNRSKNPIPKKAAPDAVTTPSRDRIRLNMQEMAKARFQDLSQQIHKIDQTMEAIDTKLGEMRVSLETIVKHYPPFPPESAERIESLRQFSTLRKIIDQLSAPRQDKELGNILKDRNSQIGHDALNIPDIGPEASDDQVHQTLNKVKVAQNSHQKRYQGFLDEVNQALNRIG